MTEVDITDEVIAREGALPIGLPKPGTEIRIDPENSEMIIVGDSVAQDTIRTRRELIRSSSWLRPGR